MRSSRTFCCLFLIAVSPAEARVGRSSVYDPPVEYYAAADGLLGADLKAALHQRIRGHLVLSYGSGGTVPALRVLDAMPGEPNKVRLLYWGIGRNASNYGGNDGQWNHEHCWPQAYGVGSGSGYSDLFNLRPCDVQANNERGSLFYAEISEGGIPVFSPLCRKTSSQWMPLPEEKGDLARAMFYMAVRYEGEAGEGTKDLELSDAPSSRARLFGKLSDLLRWHREDPVDDAERRRNHLIFSDYQSNRNPFVDEPDYAEMVFRGLPVVRTTVVQSTTIEGQDPAVVMIRRRGPSQNQLVVTLSYGGTATTGAWQSAPSSVTIPAGASDFFLPLAPKLQPGQQGTRNFTVAAAIGGSYAPVDTPAEVFLLDGLETGFATWSGGQQPTAALVYAYAIGGASSPTATDGSVVGNSVTSSHLSITAVVRVNDPNLTIVGQAANDVESGAWTTNGVTMTPGDPTGVGEGLQRQIWSVPHNNSPKKFLRLQTTLSNQ